MVEYTPEGKGRDARRLTEAQLAEAFEQGSILESTALAYDRDRQLVFELAGRPARMPHDECAAGAAQGEVRDVALLTRVGRPTCFCITALPEEGGGAYLLSRRLAQEACRKNHLDTLVPGELVKCVVTHLENFGAFCDVGCGISALLPIDCMSVSRIQSPADRVGVGQTLTCAVKSRDEKGRLVLTLRELLGTWQENADRFRAGETVVGLVRSVESYGVFIELAPNLAGLAERCEGLRPGQPVSVFIKSILPEKMKIKLVIVNRELAGPLFFAPRYFITGGRLEHWVYSTPGSKKRIETDFGPAAL
ncbi:MAG TPA: S1 RNA-binding domain-containing protein [Candidatus Fournierella pullicola]|uniref:S1 RNA-binding domain-containing protein n=1 Tax=Candidatus Allofournierella pullicola TaxID=2838596 RepID=A0A9D1V4Z7_9FIRM|nr:S1 RNA-binding domain-containing protein [Candidatus Fournierella pullicola]